jgi:hypothetical protein
LVSANQQSSDFRPVSRGANITADYKQPRFNKAKTTQIINKQQRHFKSIK